MLGNMNLVLLEVNVNIKTFKGWTRDEKKKVEGNRVCENESCYNEDVVERTLMALTANDIYVEQKAT